MLQLFVQHYDVTAEGNFEGHNILNLLKHLPRSMEQEAKFAVLRQKLFMLREKRIRPGLDDKVLADWNGLMIAALANAGAMLNEPDWIARADNAFDFIAKSMTRADRLGHSWRQGKLLYPGLASDFACMIRAALALYEATGRRERLDQALSWQTAFEATYANPQNGGYYLTASDAEGLVVRPASTTDEATPNPNAIAAQNLLRLAALTGDEQWRERADRLFDGVLSQSRRQSAVACCAIERPRSTAQCGRRSSSRALDMPVLPKRALRLPYLNRIICGRHRPALCRRAIRRRRKLLQETSAAFICVGQTCSLPVTDPAKIAEVVDAMRPRSN